MQYWFRKKQKNLQFYMFQHIFVVISFNPELQRFKCLLRHPPMRCMLGILHLSVKHKAVYDTASHSVLCPRASDAVFDGCQDTINPDLTQSSDEWIFLSFLNTFVVFKRDLMGLFGCVC